MGMSRAGQSQKWQFRFNYCNYPFVVVNDFDPTHSNNRIPKTAKHGNMLTKYCGARQGALFQVLKAESNSFFMR